MTQLLAEGFTSDQELHNESAASTLTPYTPSINSVYKYSAGFTRIGYRFRDRYLVDLNARRDGSSRFGPANEFHDFGSAAAAWIFSSEPFVKSGLPFLSFGKVRLSYGTTGNDQIADYQYLALYNPVPGDVQNRYQGTTGFVPSGLSNPYLQWELTRKLQFGLNLGFIKDRLLFSGIYFINRSSNELQRYALPALTGNSGVVENFPALVQNNGYELTLTSINFKSKNFSWSTGLNLTIPYNKLVSYPGLSTSTYADLYAVGQPITIVKVFKYLGVNSQTGVYQFATENGQASSNPNFTTDANYWVNPVPKSFGGLDNTLRYKEITLDFLFQFVSQIGANYTYGNFPGSPYFTPYGSMEAQQPTYVLSRWRAPGDVSPIQQFNSVYPANVNTAYNDVRQSTFAYSNASFIRLKNVSLSWQFPASWMQKCKIQSIRVFAQGQNLITLTRFQGMDPENQSVYALPPLRVLTLGAAVSL
jgi:hypothetical protein